MVHRPAAAPRSDWSMGRYMRHLSTWLRENAESFDVMLVDAIREESMAAIEASRITRLRNDSAFQSAGDTTVIRCGGKPVARRRSAARSEKWRTR